MIKNDSANLSTIGPDRAQVLVINGLNPGCILSGEIEFGGEINTFHLNFSQSKTFHRWLSFSFSVKVFISVEKLEFAVGELEKANVTSYFRGCNGRSANATVTIQAGKVRANCKFIGEQL